jgi:hypothetical protein
MHFDITTFPASFLCMSIGVAALIVAVINARFETTWFQLKEPLSRGARIGLAIVGVLLILAGVYSNNREQLAATDQHINAEYGELVNGASGQPPPPWSETKQYDKLNQMAIEANDASANCLIAAFISDHALRKLPLIIMARLSTAGSSPSPPQFLTCYKLAINTAKASLNANLKTLNVHDLAAFRNPATSLLEASSELGTDGWIPIKGSQTLLYTAVLGKTVGLKDTKYLFSNTGDSVDTNPISGVLPAGRSVSVDALKAGWVHVHYVP